MSMKLMSKQEAMTAYREGRIRRLFQYEIAAIEGYIPGKVLYDHVKAAKDPEKLFIVVDGANIGLYEVT